MMRKCLVAIVILTNFGCLEAQLLKTDNGIVLKNFGSTTVFLSLEIISNNIVHVTASPTNYSSSNQPLKLMPDQSLFSIKINNEEIVLKTDSLLVSVNPNNGRVTFKDKRNNTILQENNRIYKHCKGAMDYLWNTTQEFKWDGEESLYAYEEKNGQNSHINGKQLEFLRPNSPHEYPLISSSKGYAILWLNNSLSKFCSNSNKNYLWSEEASQIEYYFLYAPSSNELLDDYNKLTTALTEISKNSFGYISSPSPDEN